MKNVLSLFFIVFFFRALAQVDSVVVEGIAPDYIGQRIAIYKIDDYLTMSEVLADSSTVKNDSSFVLTLPLTEIQRLVLKIGNNHSFFYGQPRAKYTLYIPMYDQYAPYRPAGNYVELTFLDIDSTDINFQILAFNGWFNNYLALNFKDSQHNPERFHQSMNDFKDAAQRLYAKDTGTFLFDYVRFSIANNDNIQHTTNRNRYEKHDFYLKFQPILYQNDAYMDYFKMFYKGINTYLTTEVSNRVYLALLKNSPTLIMQALGREYTLINTRIRELVMIQMLSELYHTPDYPQNNVIEVLDSIQQHALFSVHKKIAKNTIARLTEAQSGGLAPELTIITQSGKKNLNSYKNRYLYIHFFDPSSEKSTIELPILTKLYDKYKEYVTFVSICKESAINEKSLSIIEQLKWETAIVADHQTTLWDKYKVGTFPYYVLIDPYSYIVQAPALGPQPDNRYRTINEVFWDIQQALKTNNK